MMPVLVAVVLQGRSDGVDVVRDPVSQGGSDSAYLARDTARAGGAPVGYDIFSGRLRRLGPDTAYRMSLQEPRKRAKAIEYSDFYQVRLKVHRILSYTMVPLFAGSYFTGDQLLEKSSDAPAWARKTHGPLATATAALFTVNTVTGLWNLWDSRKDPAGRTKRYLHALMFMAASAGFTYAGVKLAEEAEASADKRRLHRTVALSSMGLSLVSWGIMLF